MTATGITRCPVSFYKFFEARRPPSMKQPGSPFYLTIKTRNWKPEDGVWYLPSPWGKNNVGSILTQARSILQHYDSSSGKISYHSVCKTSITRLLDHDVPPNFVMQLSGHKRPESLESYYKASKFHRLYREIGPAE